MITILTEDCNDISQDFYNDMVDSLQLCQMQCAKECPTGTLIFHGSYTCCVKNPSGKNTLVVMRVKCTDCGVTHALLPSAIVPYSQIPQKNHAAIAAAMENGDNPMDVMDAESGNPEISPSQVYYILSVYIRCWQQRIRSEEIILSPLAALTQSCFAHYSRPFMQIKTTPNILFSPPT